ncbi:SLC36A [Acanthosepion pharaonis]|uniref:SLC36A n=1 Tax=Acanthosepion pharaonis TaxID=158019 RepID=A0A812CPM1_ACAPH|nr:SLC36A [Sepia pharaonis]
MSLHYERRSNEKGILSIFANIFISFIGGGVLGLPYAFREAGVIEGSVIMAVIGFISIQAMLLIVECKYKLLEQRSQIVKNYKAHKRKPDEESLVIDSSDIITAKVTPLIVECNEDKFLDCDSDEANNSTEGQQNVLKIQDLSYGDLGYFAMGRFGRMVVDSVLLISQVGFCCAYLIFICENLSDNIHGITLFECLAILLPPLCLLTLFRHLNSLSISSLFAQCSSLLAFAVVFWFDFQHIHLVTIHPKKISLSGLPFFLAISIYCYEGAGMILSLEASVVKEKRKHFKKIFIWTMMLVTALYITFGICGYLSFGPATNPIITLNLPKGKALDFAIMVKSFLCLAMFFTYPVMLFPAIKVLEGYFMQEPEKTFWKGNVLRFIVVLSTGVIVIAIPNFANLMALIGASCCTLLAFILPGLFHIIIFKGSSTFSLRAFDIFLILVGIIGAVIGNLDAFNRLTANDSSHSSQHGNITTILS